jgi:pimeloyl-ACP methyl ester carboxylesterase
MTRLFWLLFIQAALIFSANARVTILQEGNLNCPAPCPRIAVVFVHGLTGSRETWINVSTGSSFPKLLAEDPALQDKLDVYSVNYASLWNSGPPIAQVTRELSTELDHLFKDTRYSKIVFIAHSLGGNIARDYLAHVKLAYGHAALSRFRLVITLGTPFNGASLSNFAYLFSGNEQVRSVIDIRRNDFLQLLEQTQTDYLTKKLNNQCNPLEFDAGYETQPVGGLALIVTKESATVGATRNEGFHKNHIELPKPPNRDDEVYGWVRNELLMCVAGQERCMNATAPQPICSVGDF